MPGAHATSGRSPPASPRLYTLRVSLMDGPLTERFVAANPIVSRTLQIRGDQTLEDLHHAIFRAFDREEEHFYEFQLGRAPYDREGPHYVHPVIAEQDPELLGGTRPAGVVTQTTLDSLGLQVDRSFGYWFDFGDDWWHQIDVVDISPRVPPGRFPRILERVGASPPQYVDWDAEEEETSAAPPTPPSPRARRGTAEPPPSRFVLNPFLDVRWTRCPDCDQPTRLRKVPLVLRVPHHGLLALALLCRFCPLDSLLIAHQDVLEAQLHRVLGTQEPIKRYRILGVVRPELWRRGRAAKESLRLEDEAAIHPFRETERLGLQRGGWGPAELHS
jgi:hypothetical protein